MTHDSRGRRYPRIRGAWSNAPVEVGADEWVSQPDAAGELRVPLLLLGWIIVCEHLTPANGPDGEEGVTRASLDREIGWRNEATIGSRLGRWVKNTVRWF
jgi:hypothetical protein